MTRPRVLVTDLPLGDDDLLRETFTRAGVDLHVAEKTDAASLAADAEGVDAIMTCFAQVPASVLNRATRCKTVARFGVGVDNIDVERATELGMIVSNVPDYCADEVADHVLLLILALARRLPTHGGPNTPDQLPVRLAGKTLGIVGLGTIGKKVIARAHAIGMHVVAHTRSGATVDGATPMQRLDDLLFVSDIVTLHLPLNNQTRGLIGARELGIMKDSAFLINTARGGLVDTDALYLALRNGQLAGAGLDVTEPEPLAADHPLHLQRNVVITPHVAYASDGALRELVIRAATNVIDVLEGREPPTVVNTIARQRHEG